MTDNNSKAYGPNFEFKGQVKIEDVKSQFDLLVDGINSQIDTYNDAGYVTEIDYNDVSPELSPLNYTLSVGGLRKVLDAYDGSVLGCNVFKDGENLVITEGLLITRNGGYRLPSAIIKDEEQSEIWFSPSKNAYKGSSVSVTETTDFIMPTITSNESWGKVQHLYARRNSEFNWNMVPSENRQAWKALTNEGMYLQGLINNNLNYDFQWSWRNFPSTVTCTGISFDVGMFKDPGATTPCLLWLELLSPKGDKILIKEQRTGNATISVKVDKYPITGINIMMRWNNTLGYIGYGLKNVAITGTYNKTSAAGGGISGAKDLVKVAVLNRQKTTGNLNVLDYVVGLPNKRLAGSTCVTRIDVDGYSSADKKNAVFIGRTHSGTGLYTKIYKPAGADITLTDFEGFYTKTSKPREVDL